MNFTARDSSMPSAPMLAWEESNCPLCEGTHWSPLVEAADPLPTADGLWFMVVKCAECGLCFTNPRPGPDNIGRFYPASYVCHRRSAKPRRRKRNRIGPDHAGDIKALRPRGCDQFFLQRRGV